MHGRSWVAAGRPLAHAFVCRVCVPAGAGSHSGHARPHAAPKVQVPTLAGGQLHSLLRQQRLQGPPPRPAAEAKKESEKRRKKERKGRREGEQGAHPRPARQAPTPAPADLAPPPPGL